MVVEFNGVNIPSDPELENQINDRKKRAHRDTEEGQKDKNGKPLKFSRDLESDWTIKNEVPHFGLKEYTPVK
jgi:hypothetical protein